MISSSPPSPLHQYHVVAACRNHSPLGDRAVEEALLLCATRPHAFLHVVTVATAHARGVVLPGSDSHVIEYAEAQERARLHLERIVERCLADGPHVSLERIASHVTTGEPAASICSLADDLDADVIVLGTHDRHGLGRMLHTSLATEVMRRASCGVLVIRPRDFLGGEQLPEVQPPLQPGEHALLSAHPPHTYHYDSRSSRPPSRIMPAL